MHNLDQIRAENALLATGHKSPPAPQQRLTPVEDRAVTKLPALIVNNGLLATAAFARKSDELLHAMDAVARHLADLRIHRLSPQSTRTEALVNELASSSSQKLRLASEEALAYLSYLKRFAKKENSESEV
jgi:CRISPR-associated protein Cmr5